MRDLSATGAAVYVGDSKLPEGCDIQLDITLGDTPVLKDVSACTVRIVEEGVMALRFHKLEHRKEVILDKLVLEVQKRLIDMRKTKSKSQGSDEESAQ